MTLFLVLFSGLWIAGWVASYLDTSISQEPSLWRRAWLMFVLFFIWPYIAFAQMRCRH